MLLRNLCRAYAKTRYFPFRYKVVRTLFRPSPEHSHPFDVDFYGFRYAGNLSNEIDWNVYFFGAYAPEELALLRDVANALRANGQGVVFWDIGANVGNHALFMSRHADEVICFEPYAPVRNELIAKLDRNDVGNVRVLDIGLSDTSGEVRFSPPREDNLGNGRVIESDSPVSDQEVTISTEVGDKVARDLGLARPSIVKIDIEGHEVFALKGLEETLRDARPVVLMEMLGRTRELLGSEARLREVLPDDVEISEVVRLRDGGYRLTALQFGTAREIVAIPRELLPLK